MIKVDNPEHLWAFNRCLL
ncbi:hypothetical protein CGLO_14172 [Colletotrichum gloeosporioides Cg-14]|uniref:Uncharacterized protein n=1 Tax=Colletotrichum gloeosporioides (strain Cg-14) TaxID=1237896 RepID=T0K4E9_COLGC|nr:hypothetical protein CGLO_14172 [Colletotrichum gloeosporioides Cg-14]